MPFELSLIDLMSPYVLEGNTFGAWYAVLRVSVHEAASDENSLTILGNVDFEGNLTVDPGNISLAWGNTENRPENDASRRDPWMDVRDGRLEFQLVVLRVASHKVSTAVAAIGASPAFANTAQVLAAYDNVPTDAPPSDYPSTGFVLERLLTTVVLHPPFLRGAKRDPNGHFGFLFLNICVNPKCQAKVSIVIIAANCKGDYLGQARSGCRYKQHQYNQIRVVRRRRPGSRRHRRGQARFSCQKTSLGCEREDGLARD